MDIVPHPQVRPHRPHHVSTGICYLFYVMVMIHLLANDSATLHSPSVVDEHPPQPIRRRRRVRGYCVNSDEEPESFSETDDDDTKPLLGGPSFDDDDYDEQVHPPAPIKISFNPVGWIAASLLPQYTERIEVPPDPGLNFFERAISSFTVYNEMKQARCNDDFDRVFTRLQIEWSYTAGIVSLYLYIWHAFTHLTSLWP